ncbi:hypothetical protein T01_5460 [Trichinella spiralis]|nr:hypothetical protein T01_5460 [Trichinella spiralis]
MEANERWRQRSEYWRYFSFLCFSSTITAISQLYLVIILVLHNFLFILCRYSIYDGIRISDLWMSSIIYYTNIHVTTVFRMKRIRKTSQPKEFETHKHLSIRSSLENAACSLSCFATAPLSQKKFLYQLFLQGCRFISYPLSNLLHFHTLRAVFVPLLNWEH